MNQLPGEPREHHLGEVLQGRSKSKFHIILFDSSVFLGSGFHNSNYIRNEKEKYFNSKLSNFQKFLLLYEKSPIEHLNTRTLCHATGILRSTTLKILEVLLISWAHSNSETTANDQL